MQFRQLVPVQQSQQYNPVPPQHFYPVGRGAPLMNVGLPPHQTLPPQFSQPMQFPPRAGLTGHSALPSQAIPLPIAQNMHITSEKSMPQINAQTPNSYSPGLGGPERPLTSSYAVRVQIVLISEFLYVLCFFRCWLNIIIYMQFASPSYGQLHSNFNASTQYQFPSQMNAADVSSGRQLSLLSESQSTASVAEHTKQPSVATAVAAVRHLLFLLFTFN